jgi:hypothetical protein
MQTRKIAYFLAYQNTTKKWSTVSKSALENLNSPSLHILPVYTTGEHGEQTTWGEYIASNNITVKPQTKPSENTKLHEINITMPLVRQSCRLLFFLFYLNSYLGCIALGLLMASSFNSSAFFGVLGGLAVAAILHFIVSQVVSDS